VNNNNLLLKDANNAFKKRRYDETSVLLEKYCDANIRDPFPFLLLSISYLQTNKLVSAQTALKKMMQIDPDYSPGIQLQAYLYMKAAPDLKSAMTFYVELLGRYSNDRGIRRGISVLRNAVNFSEFQRNAKLFDFVKVPRFHGTLSWTAKSKKPLSPIHYNRKTKKRRNKHLIIAVVILLFSIIAVFGLYIADDKFSFLQQHFQVGNNNSDITRTVDQITVDGSGYNLIEKIANRRTPEFYYSSDVLLNEFRHSKLLIKAGKYNDALLILNRIANSNATHSVRERAEFLKNFIINIDEREWQKISFSAVREKPYQYSGYSIEWSGKTANIKKREGKIVFNLLVDYMKNNEFSGIVDVYTGFDVPWLKNGDEVIIKAVIMSIVGNEQRLYLTAKEINKK
jgi:tetratricopeptide (TPR) repeat protein